MIIRGGTVLLKPEDKCSRLELHDTLCILDSGEGTRVHDKQSLESLLLKMEFVGALIIGENARFTTLSQHAALAQEQLVQQLSLKEKSKESSTVFSWKTFVYNLKLLAYTVRLRVLNWIVTRLLKLY